MVSCDSFGAWLSLAERTVRDREVGGSNPLAPTISPLRVGDPDGPPAMMAAEIVVEGYVQGVGYRNYAQRKASMLGLIGFVMNLRDGRVRVRAEGARETIEELVRDLQKGPPLSRVEKVNVTWLPPTGRFAAFGIRYAEFDP